MLTNLYFMIRIECNENFFGLIFQILQLVHKRYKMLRSHIMVSTRSFTKVLLQVVIRTFEKSSH